MKRLFNPSWLCLLVAVIVVAWGLRAPAEEPSVRIENASGEVQLVNSKDGSAIFSAGNLAPGKTVSGTVQLSNTGSGEGDLDLKQSDLVDTPGPGLGALSGALNLTIQDVTNPIAPVTVFAGAPSALGNAPLGKLAPGQSRTYSFSATLPAGATSTVAAASMKVRYVWTLTGQDSGPGDGGGGGGSIAGTGGGSGPGTSTMPVTLKVDTRKWASKSVIAVKALCAEACTLNAYAAAKGKPAVRTRRKSARAQARKWVTIKLKLSKATKKALGKRLKRKKGVPITVTVTATDPRRAVRTVTKKATVKRAKRKR